MADTNKNVNINIKINGADKAKSDLSGIGGQAENAAKKITSSFDGASRTFVGLNTNLGSFGASIGSLIGPIGLAATAVGAFMAKAISDSSKAQDSMIKLSNSLKRVGDTSKESLNDVLAWADALEKSSNNSAEAYQDQFSYARSLGFSTEATKKLITVAADLSAATGDSLESSMTKLIATTNGVAGSFGKTIPGFKNLTTEALKAGAGVEKISETFGGSARQQAETFSGRLNQISVRAGDVVEKFGDLIVQSPGLSKALTNIASILSGLPNFFDKVTTAMGKMFPQLKVVAEGLGYVLQKWAEWIGEPSDDKKKVESIKSLKKEIKDIQKEIQALTTTSKLGITSPDDEKKLASLNNQLATSNALLKTQQSQLQEIRKNGGVAPDKTRVGGVGGSDPEQANKQQAIKEQSELLDAQLNLQKEYYANLAVIRKAQETATEEEMVGLQNSELELTNEFNLAKLEQQTAYEEQKNLLTMTGVEARLANQVLNDKLELDQNKLRNDTLLAQDKALADQQKKIDDKEKKQKEASDKQYISDLSSTFSTIATLSNSHNKTLAAIGKASALANITINTAQGVSKAWALGPILGPVLSGLVIAAGAAQAAQVAGVKFANGGIFNAGGTSIQGDNNIARLNDREMVLNMQQQRNVFDAINSGGIGGGLMNTVLVDIRDILSQQRLTVDLDGEKLNKKLTEIDDRRLAY